MWWFIMETFVEQSRMWLIGYGAFLHICIVLWIWKDSGARINNLTLQMLSILIWMVPFVWLPIYLLIRPIRYKFDKNGRREALDLSVIECKNCLSFNLKENKHCITCGDDLKIKCKECKNHYSHEYEYCPDCSAPNLR